MLDCDMSNIQVKRVPKTLHQKLRLYTKRQGKTIRDFVLEAVTRELEREDFYTRLAKRSAIRLNEPAAAWLMEARQEHSKESGR